MSKKPASPKLPDREYGFTFATFIVSCILGFFGLLMTLDSNVTGYSLLIGSIILSFGAYALESRIFDRRDEAAIRHINALTELEKAKNFRNDITDTLKTE